MRLFLESGAKMICFESVSFLPDRIVCGAARLKAKKECKWSFGFDYIYVCMDVHVCVCVCVCVFGDLHFGVLVLYFF